MKIAFFDIGTNSIHMKVVEFHDAGAFEVLEHEKDMTRIGAGSFSSRKLSKRAMKRAVRVIARFAETARGMGASRFVAVATSAVRDAKNGHQFLKELRKKTGVAARVISGEEEGRLIFLGTVSGIGNNTGRIAVLDVGGGSMELITGTRKKIDFVESLALGVARLSSRFLPKNPPSRGDLRGLENHIEDMIGSAVKKAGRRPFARVIGTGGTMINLASMIYEEREGRRLRLRGYYEMKRKDLIKLYEKLIKLSAERIEKLPGLDKKRADIITAGSALVLTLMKSLKTDRIHVSDKGIREGMILDFIFKKKKLCGAPPPSVPVQWFGQKPFFSGKLI